MKYTSAEAFKLLNRLIEELNSVEKREEQSREFLAALGENVESVRPFYDYFETQKKIQEIERKIHKIKHSINIFNTTQVIQEFNMTIDQMLIYIPQLKKRQEKLSYMKDLLPKSRKTVIGYEKNAVIDYLYANYDIEQIKMEYDIVSENLLKAQTAVDLVNHTVSMEIDI